MQNINKTVQKGEKVEVMALFNYSQIPCQPLYFRRRGESEVEITDTLSERIKFVGNHAKHIFQCVAGKMSCQLEFDSASLAWTLIECQGVDSSIKISATLPWQIFFTYNYHHHNNAQRTQKRSGKRGGKLRQSSLNRLNIYLLRLWSSYFNFRPLAYLKILIEPRNF